ncbi:putative reverse transcriptase domain-containing protein [Tanacetum coccineum]|uniref:Reverse transcriptase domain-containing protein n=1 Tax=Tanacetum coccineum TaxID=301880 RepID=A0ABQ5DCU2_9ASTR
MTAHHNHWDTSATRDETSRNISSTTTTESLEVVRQLELMNKNFVEMMRQIQTVKSVDTKCETFGGPHSFTECPAVSGYTQEAVYATTGDVKAITTRSGVAYDGPTIPPTPSPLLKEVERKTEATKDKVQNTSLGSTATRPTLPVGQEGTLDGGGFGTSPELIVASVISWSAGPVWGCDKLVIRAKVIENQIMAASAIAISSDSSDESVGSPPSRVILFGDIPTVIPSTSVVAPETSTIALVISSAAPVVETTLVASPTGLCGLVPYSDSDSDSPDEMSSPEHISPLPAISPFLCTDSSKAPDSSDGPPSQDPYVMVVARWRSKVASRPSSSSEFPIAPVTALPGIRRRSAILIRPEEAIPFGRPYRTHLNGPRKLLITRKRVGPLPARRLTWRRASPHSSDHYPPSSSSSPDSSPVHSSGLDTPDQAHSGSSTRDVPPRLCYPPRRAPRHSEAFHRWCASPLSTLYLPTTSKSSSGDSSERPLHSSSHSAGPSHKRCRSPVDYVPSFTPVMGSLAPTRVDLLPPRKRFKDSYSSEASIEEDTEIDPLETEVDMELVFGDGDDVRDHVEIDPRNVKDDTEEYETNTSAGDTVEVGIDLMSAPIVEEEIVEPAGEDSSDSSGTRDGIVRSFEDMPIDLDDAVRDFYHHMSEVRTDRIVGIETVQRRLEADQLIARGERAGMIERIESLRLENLKVRAMLDIERDRVNSLRLHMSLSQEEFCQVRRDRDDTWGRLRRLESTMTNTRSGMTPAVIEEMINQCVDAALEACQVNRDLGLGNGNDNGGGYGNGNGTGNGNNEGDDGDGNENRNVNGRGDRPGARECTYQDFMKCQPLSFKGTEGVVGLIRWSEKMETVFHISNCPERYQVKYATCTLLNSALTWWNSHKRTIGTDAAYALSWRELLKLMTEVYCPRNEIQKMETELWNLSVKNNDMATYTQRFQELTMMCTDYITLSTSQPPIPSPHQSSPHPLPLRHSPPHSPPQSLPHSSPPRSYEAPLPEGNTSGSAEASLQLKELMVLVPSLVSRVTGLETELKEIKQTLGNAVVKLVKKVKSLETALKRKSKKGRLKKKKLVLQSGGAAKTFLSKLLLRVLAGKATIRGGGKGKRYRRKARSMAKKIDTGLDAEEEINTGREEINTGIEEVSTGSTKVDSGTASKRGQREGKAPMVEEDIQATHKTKEQMRQEEAGLEEAIKLQAQLDEEVAKQIHLDKMIAKRMAEEEALTEQQKKRKAQVQFEAQFYTKEDWDAIKAKLEANAELQKIDKEEFESSFSQIDTFVPINLEATKAKLKRYGEELQTKTSKKQKIDDKDVPAIGEKVAEVKEKEPSKNEKKQNARKRVYGINRHEDAYDRVLWSDLGTMFDPPLIEDAIWSLPLQQKMCMSTRSNSSNLFSPLRDPESLIRRRNLGEPSSLFNFEEVMSIPYNNMGSPPAGPPPPNNNGPPLMVQPNGQAPRSMEELCQPSIIDERRLNCRSSSGNPTPTNPIITYPSSSFTPFEGGGFILEEIKTFLHTPDELSNLDDDYYDTEGDILYLEKLLNESLSTSPSDEE